MKTDYIYQTKRIMKIIICTPIFIPFLILGLFIELLKFIGKTLLKISKEIDIETSKWVDKGTWLDDISEWINKQ